MIIGFLVVICFLAVLFFGVTFTKGNTAESLTENVLAEKSSEEKASDAKGTSDSVPAWNAEVTAENVLLLLKHFDQDGYFLVDQGYKMGDDILSYYNHSIDLLFGQESPQLMDCLGVVVHEEFHSYVGDTQKDKWTDMKFYLGNGRSLIVPITEVFNTSEMAESVPDQCRTSRYSTYISEPQEDLGANVYGAYGLLNEFCAYQWEINNDTKMYEYYDKYSDDAADWTEYISHCENQKQAYAEFKYYILHYLSFAKEHHPDVYKGIMENSQFRKVYRIAERRFSKRIKNYEKSLDHLQATLEQEGYTVERTKENFQYHKQDGNTYLKDFYDKESAPLTQELEKPEYVQIHEELVK